MSIGSACGQTARDPHSEIGVVGLGLMGTAFTERLLEQGYAVRVWNRTREKADPLVALGAAWSENPIADCDRVLLSLYSGEVVDEVLSQMSPALRPGQLLIDTTTGEPDQSRMRAAALARQGVDYLDAPVSGSSEQTRRGEVTVLVSGARAAYERGGDLWPILGRKVFYVGESGTAARMKLVSNLVLGLNRAALAEGLAFAGAIGIDRAAALEILEGSMAYSKVMEVKGRKMLEGDFRVQAKLSQHLKDVRLMLRAAAEAGLPLPLSETHCGLLERAEALGLGELDNSAILRVWEEHTS